jgi:hypothetical protein
MEDLFKKRNDHVNTCWVKRLADGTETRVTFDDWYADVSVISLSEFVPAEIREQFDIARNTLLYSWFSYRLRMVGLLYSYAVVENALREKLQVTSERGPGLGTLLRKAVADGVLNDSGFCIPRAGRHTSSKREGDHFILEVTYDPPSLSDLQLRTTYVMQLCESIPRSRNSLAHGHASLSIDVLTPMMENAEIINMLFEPHKSISEEPEDRKE